MSSSAQSESETKYKKNKRQLQMSIAVQCPKKDSRKRILKQIVIVFRPAFPDQENSIFASFLFISPLLPCIHNETEPKKYWRIFLLTFAMIMQKSANEQKAISFTKRMEKWRKKTKKKIYGKQLHKFRGEGRNKIVRVWYSRTMDTRMNSEWEREREKNFSLSLQLY